MIYCSIIKEIKLICIPYHSWNNNNRLEWNSELLPSLLCLLQEVNGGGVCEGKERIVEQFYPVQFSHCSYPIVL